jgi:hypothetical protein
MTRQQKIDYYNVIKQALERRYPIIISDPQSLGISEDDVDQKIAEAISLLKGEGLPEDSDTLKELADKIVANAVNDTIVLNQAKAYTDDKVANLQTTIDVPSQEEVDIIFEVNNDTTDPILEANPTFYYPLTENLDPIGATSTSITSNGAFIVDETEGKVSEVTSDPGVNITVNADFGAYTLTGKLKLTAKGGTNEILKVAAEDGSSLGLYLLDTDLSFGTSVTTVDINDALLDDWVTVHFVYNNIDTGNNSGSGFLYVNGVLHTTVEVYVDEAISPHIDNVYVSAIDEPGSALRFKNIALFDRVLTDEEIRSMV